MSNSFCKKKPHLSSIYTRFNTRYVIPLFSYTDTLFEWSQMKIIKPISNILLRNNFLCLKPVCCCLTFVCMYITETKNVRGKVMLLYDTYLHRNFTSKQKNSFCLCTPDKSWNVYSFCNTGQSGWKYQDFSSLQRYNYYSDLKWKLYEVTSYNVTPLYREFSFWVKKNLYMKSRENPCFICTQKSYTWCFNSQNLISVHQIGLNSLPTKYYSYIKARMGLIYMWSFSLSSWKIYVLCNFYGIIYQQTVGIPMGTNCATLMHVADLWDGI